MRAALAALVVLVVVGLVGCSNEGQRNLNGSSEPLGLSSVSLEGIVPVCEDLFGSTFGAANSEPLGACQWDMALIDVPSFGGGEIATGKGVTVGLIDGGIDFDHPDIAPNVDVDRSCSFIFDDTPTAMEEEIANGDCSNKDAVADAFGHGTAVGSIVAAPVNGIGIAGVAPEATLVALKACTTAGYCFADSVAAALRYAADEGIDVVNMSLYADPYLYYCGSEPEQRAILRELQAAARYAQRKGVVIVAAATNELIDLQHPVLDVLSPEWPPDAAQERTVHNQCRVLPAELPGVLTVSSTGPVGVPGYAQWIASESAVGMSRIDVAAPGGDYFAATGTAQDGVLAAVPVGSVLWDWLDSMSSELPGVTVFEDGVGYAFLTGTSIATPHAAGVAALVRQAHSDWGSGAVVAAVRASATHLDCPADWEPLDASDERARCYGHGGRTSFFGFGLVDAEAASMR
ncbi:MAG: S8 family serine peptidase [Deinococcales bacterium]